MILVDKRHPVLQECANKIKDWDIGSLGREGFQLRPVSGFSAVIQRHMNATHRVHVFQMEPRKRYHTRSLSLEAYSERSNADEFEGTRRRLREMSSSAREIMSGRFDSRSVESNDTECGVKNDIFPQVSDTYHRQAV